VPDTSESMTGMSIIRVASKTTGRMVITYNGDPLTPEFDPKNPEETLMVLSTALDNAYNKIRDAEIE